MRGRPFPAFAAGACLLAAVVTLFPVLVAGRVVSPLDTVANEPPWRGVRPPVQVANPELGEAATAVLPRLLLARRTGLATAVWNPYVACGSPGWLAWGSGVASPFVLPWLWVVDEAHLLNLVVLGKLLVAFWFTWALLRRRGLPETAAALGGLAYALAGPVAGRWLWPESSGSALFPALLLAVDRLPERPGRGAAEVGAAALLLAAGATPGLSVLAAYLALAWGWRRAVERGSWRIAGATVAGLATAAAALAPAVALRLTWPLPDLAAARTAAWGPGVLRLLVDPWAWGDPRAGTFAAPVEGLGWHAAGLTVGATVVTLAALGVTARSRDRWWWSTIAAASFATIAFPSAASAVRALPGLADVGTAAFSVPGALALAALAALGWSALERIVPARWAPAGAAVTAVSVILGQGLLAGHLLTFLRPEEARLEATPVLERLAARVRPGERIAPLFTAVPPDTAMVLGFEDIRSVWGAPEGYRELLRRIDPQSWGPYGRAVLLNGATIRLTHPDLAALGVRWILEPPELHLVEFALADGVEQLEPRTGRIGLRPGTVVEQELDLPGGLSRILLPLAADPAGRAVLAVRLLGAEGGSGPAVTVESAPGFTPWIDVPGDTAPGRVTLRIEAVRVTGRVWLWTAPAPQPGAGSLRVEGLERDGVVAVALDRSGIALADEGPDLRVWENRRALPPAWAVERVVAGASGPPPGASIARVATVAGSTAPVAAGPAEVEARAEAPGRLRVRVRSPDGTLLATALAGPPEVWEARIDGRRVAPVAIDGGLVGVRVPPGEHEVTLRPRLAPGWWALTAAGLAAMVGTWWLGKGDPVR